MTDVKMLTNVASDNGTPVINGKTLKANDLFINKNKTENIKGKNYRFTTTCKVDYTDVTQLKLQK